MATHCSVLAWRIPGMGEPGGLPSLGSHRVGHDWSDLALSSSPLLGEGRGRLLGVHHCLSYFWHTDFYNTYLLRKMLILHHGWDRWFEICLCHWGRASLVAQTVKDLLAKQKTWVLSLGQEDPLEKGMATHSSILVCRIPWTEEPSGLAKSWMWLSD